jgi:nucleoside-diphosphate-sugar epimerase
VIVTGGGGWLGQTTLDLLDHALGADMGERVLVYGSHARLLPLASGRQVPCRTLAALADYTGPPPLVLHYACVTRDRVAGMGAANVLAANREIREAVAALLERAGARGVFLPSSGAVYDRGRGLTTDAEGNPYGLAKRHDEERFLDLAAAGGIPLVLARVFNLAGPFINKPGTYALASFLLDVLAERPIEIRARGRVVRSYVHVADLLLMALGALLLLPAASGAVRFDTAGEVAVELGELATRAAAVLGRPYLPIRRAPPDGRPDDVYCGEGARMRALAARLMLPLSPLEAQIRDTATFLAATARGRG